MIKKDNKTVWDLKRGEKYWRILFNNNIVGEQWWWWKLDKKTREIGNAYLSEEEAKKARDKKIAIVKVNRNIDELNWKREPDWSHTEQKKYNIHYTNSDWFTVETFRSIKHPMQINYINSFQNAKKIIDKMEDELRTIFEIE